MTSKLCHEGQRLCQHLHRRKASFDTLALCCKRQIQPQCREYASAATASAVNTTGETPHTISSKSALEKSPFGTQAQQKEADREFFADLLSSAATKRDAKAYLSRLQTPVKLKPASKTPGIQASGSYVNVGDLFRGSRAAEMSPVFSHTPLVESEFQEQETLHVALVKIRDIAQLAVATLTGIAETLAQLNRLSISPCVVVESTTAKTRADLGAEVDMLVTAINKFGNVARRVDNVFSLDQAGKVAVFQRKLLLRPLRREHIPVVTTVACDEPKQQMVAISPHDAMLALTKEFAGLNVQSSTLDTPEPDSASFQEVQKQVALDRIITIDSAGGVPNDKAADGRHVFLNLEQEYEIVKLRLQAKHDSPAAITHLANLDLLNQALQMLPPSCSGLMTTYEETANRSRDGSSAINPKYTSGVGTRRQKNALIHNLLTDKPAYSASLPPGRLGLSHEDHSQCTESCPSSTHSSFVKRGMPLTIFPNPFEKPWNSTDPRLRLTDSRVDLARLVYLIEDSFNRKLDIEHYLERVDDKIAGVIIAGEYEGGAILTWETPPDRPDAEPVPYLDKFAVLKRSQGAGGVADIVFNAMVRSCFPSGVCWRSRRNNPVNKWYFERSKGTWKIDDHWCMFWTGEGVETNSQRFSDYVSVCRGVQPSWADRKKPAD